MKSTVTRGIAIDRISDDRATQHLCRMDANLVRPPRFNVKTNESERTLSPKDFIMRNGALMVDGRVQHSLDGTRRRVFRTTPMTDGEICLVHVTMRLKLTTQRKIGGLRTCENHHAARVNVKAVDDARAFCRTDMRHFGIMANQLVCQRTRRMTWRRMHDLPGGLVNDDDCRVREEKIHSLSSHVREACTLGISRSPHLERRCSR